MSENAVWNKDIYTCCGGNEKCAVNKTSKLVDQVFALYETDKDQARLFLWDRISEREELSDWRKHKLDEVTEELYNFKLLHKMQSELLHNEIAFWGSKWVADPTVKDSPLPGQKYVGIQFCVMCNDVFELGTADCENVLDKELETVYNIFKEYGRVGVEAWVARKRAVEPQEQYLIKHPEYKEIYESLK